MTATYGFRQLEFRKQVTDTVLGVLADLPESQRKIFIWKHYCGYETERIAEILKTNLSETERTLSTLNTFLYQKTRSLVVR